MLSFLTNAYPVATASGSDTDARTGLFTFCAKPSVQINRSAILQADDVYILRGHARGVLLEKVKGFIVVLGSLNSESGELNVIGKKRCEAALTEHKRRPGWKLLLTGGYGAHFNTTDKPHAVYMKEYLIKRGLREQDFVEFAESANTVEDASCSKPIVLKYGIPELLVVTSDYHSDRASYVFEKKFAGVGVHVRFLLIPTDEANCGFDLEAQTKHEREALARLKRADGQKT